jgi:bifunctional non-homologous end joining protein LigD
VACVTRQAVKRPAAFIPPCQPIAANHAPSGPDWAHELKHDGYRLQIHVYEGRVSLYTIDVANPSKCYPLIVRNAARIEGSAIIDAEVVWFDSEGTPDFDVLYSGVNDGEVSACAFDLLILNGEDFRCKPYVDRKAALRELVRHGHGIQYVEHAEGHGDTLFEAVCRLGLEGIVYKKLDAPYCSGPSKTWIKIKNPKAPAATRPPGGIF